MSDVGGSGVEESEDDFVNCVPLSQARSDRLVVVPPDLRDNVLSSGSSSASTSSSSSENLKRKRKKSGNVKRKRKKIRSPGEQLICKCQFSNTVMQHY